MIMILAAVQLIPGTGARDHESGVHHMYCIHVASGFSACNIEKLGVAWKRGYMYIHTITTT